MRRSGDVAEIAILGLIGLAFTGLDLLMIGISYQFPFGVISDWGRMSAFVLISALGIFMIGPTCLGVAGMKLVGRSTSPTPRWPLVVAMGPALLIVAALLVNWFRRQVHAGHIGDGWVPVVIAGVISLAAIAVIAYASQRRRPAAKT